MSPAALSDASDVVEVVFSIGSNFGNRDANVREGLKWLSSILTDFRCSSVYATPDCHGGSKEYMNAVAIGITSSTPKRLESLCKDYEITRGRTPEMRRAGNVPIDIDLVVYDSKVLRPNDFKRDFFRIGYSMI